MGIMFMRITVFCRQLTATFAVVLFANWIYGGSIPAAVAQTTSRANVSKSKSCYLDEPVSVTITGTLVEHTFPGPPGYESIADGDEPETVFLLVFNPPICTVGYTLEEMEKQGYWDAPHSKIDKMELVFIDDPAYLYKKLRPYLGKSVQCTGELFDAQTAHHHTPVLIMIFKRNCVPVLEKK